MPNKKPLLLALLVLGLVLAGSACKKPPTVEPTLPPPEEPTQAPQPEQPHKPPVEVEQPFESEQMEPPVELTKPQAEAMLKTVYFEFDKADLTPETRATLRANADFLRQHTGFGVVIEGHCDERGTIEYNIELGQRRARAVRDFLSSLGVRAGRMRTVSYGEERPVDPGHNEAAWSKNRRAEFKVE